MLFCLQNDAAKLWRCAAEMIPLDSPLAYVSLFPPAFVWSQLADAEEDAGCPSWQVKEATQVTSLSRSPPPVLSTVRPDCMGLTQCRA